ncbi:hypothetical protein HDV01_004857 [Terramyces sp. JEL0728]|nr:hypothetical protein HDV01_004857 [Terramyces sp. JEL0728]
MSNIEWLLTVIPQRYYIIFGFQLLGVIGSVVFLRTRKQYYIRNTFFGQLVKYMVIFDFMNIISTLTLWPLVVYNNLTTEKVMEPFINPIVVDMLNAVFGNIEEFFQQSSLLLSFGISAITYYIVCLGGNTLNINMKSIFIAIFLTSFLYALARFICEMEVVFNNADSHGFNNYLEFACVWASTIPLSFCYFASYLQLRHQISQRVQSGSRAQEAIHTIMIKLIQSLNISNVIIWTPLMANSFMEIYKYGQPYALGGTLMFILRISAGARGFIHYIVLYVLFKDTQIYDFEYTPHEISPILQEVQEQPRSFDASALYGRNHETSQRNFRDENSELIGNNLGLLSESRPAISSSLSLGNSFTLGASP